MGEKKVLTTWEAGRYCNTSPYTIRHWINSGRLEAYTTPGGHRRILRKDLDDFLRRHQMPVPTAFHEGDKRVLILAAGSDAQAIARDVRAWTDDLDVTLAGSGFEAGLEISSRLPHLFLVDLDDTHWDGMDVLKTLRAHAGTSGLHLAAMSRDVSVESMETLQHSGVLRCFSKPVDRTELWRLLKQLFPLCQWKVDLRTVPGTPSR